VSIASGGARQGRASRDYDPSRNDLFTATKGRGSYMNNRRIRVAKRTRLQECLISTGFPYRVTMTSTATCA